MDIGIPKYASSTGGVYFYKDGRDVPDVWNATFEYPDKDLTLLYSASLSSNNPRGNRICLLYTSPSPRDRQKSRMPSSA